MTNQLVYISSLRVRRLLMAVGKGFLDQYSVFCVFGSVVGCVVVPLITQVCSLLLYFCRKTYDGYSLPINSSRQTSCT